MKTFTPEQEALWHTLPIRERVAMKSALWEVGDTTHFSRDGVDFEGKIIAIEDGVATIETPWATFTEKLALCFRNPDPIQ